MSNLLPILRNVIPQDNGSLSMAAGLELDVPSDPFKPKPFSEPLWQEMDGEQGRGREFGVTSCSQAGSAPRMQI